MELIIVLIIVGITSAVCFPNFYTSTQRAYSQAAKNNLLSIYSVQLNYFNDKNGYCLNTSASPCDNLTDINTNLNLNMMDGVYQYICCTNASGFICMATNGAITCGAQSGNTTLKIKNTAVTLGTMTGATNPSCTGKYCPY